LLKEKRLYKEVKEPPPGQRAVDLQWVLHIKWYQDGQISQFKARLVAKGFTQIPGQDFNYTFAPVAQWESICTLLTLAASSDMQICQIDGKTVFLNGPLEEEIYMCMPSIVGPGFWPLHKGLYSLKQTRTTWHIITCADWNRIRHTWLVKMFTCFPDQNPCLEN
jgi:hypothetical protein